MAPGEGEYEGLTDAEIALLTEESAQQPGEDASDWATRAAAANAAAKVKASQRREEARREAEAPAGETTES